jgi:methionyl-tRNA formyltransferase
VAANRRELDLYLRGFKGLRVLQSLCEGGYARQIRQIILDRETNVARDYSEDIVTLARKYQIHTQDHGKQLNGPLAPAGLSLAVGWRFKLDVPSLLVMHDSPLPRYRGFNPLVSMLINGEEVLGATLLKATDEIDAGCIIAQKKLRISYPCRVEQAMGIIGDLYVELVMDLMRRDSIEHLTGREQDHAASTYSLWRDDLDYFVDWTKSASELERFVDAVSFPYSGAKTLCERHTMRILRAKAWPDIKIENRVEGKIFCIDEGCPIVVCRVGLLRLEEIVDDKTAISLLPWQTFKQRFCSGSARGL